MASKDNDNSVGMAVGFICAGLMVIGMFIFALLAFLAFVFTILAVMAWNEPLRLGKKLTIEPEEARAFVGRGLIGAVALPAFAVFSAVMFGIDINDNAWGYLLVGGYAGGSIGLEILFVDGNPPPAQNQHIVPVERLSAPAQLQPEPRAEMEPFRFASWDDEDERS